jgi:hypothetical protein
MFLVCGEVSMASEYSRPVFLNLYGAVDPLPKIISYILMN